jgi:hypothetical protein
MLVRIDANAPREAIKMALDFAASNGFAVDFRTFGPQVKTSVKTPKPSEKAVRKASEKPKKVVKKAVKPEAVPDDAKELRKLAETGSVKLPKEVYAALRSKNETVRKSAIDAARVILDPQRWDKRDAGMLMAHMESHQAFLHGNPLLDTAK